MAAEIFTDLSRATSANGTTLTGATWTFYAAGTSTPQAVYANANLSTSLGSVVTADSGGMFVPIYFNSALSYRGVLKNFDGATLRDIDPINAGVLNQLAGKGGAALIGAATGGTVEDGIWKIGNQTAVRGSELRVDKLLEANTVEPLKSRGGYWPGSPVYVHAGISKAFDDSVVDGITNGGPFAALFVNATNNGSDADVCGQIIVANARLNNRVAFGLNVLATNTANTTGTKLVGMEIDLQPSAGTTISANSIGLAINAFSIACPAPAILTGGVGGGTFNNGIVLGGLATSAAGLALTSGGNADSLTNTTVGTFAGTAHTMGTGTSRGLLWTGGGKSTRSYFDGTNHRQVLPTGGSWIWRDPADGASLVSINTVGTLNLEAGGSLQVSSLPVVGARKTGWATATGTATRTAFDTSTVTLPQLAERVKALIDDFHATAGHGLIGA